MLLQMAGYNGDFFQWFVLLSGLTFVWSQSTTLNAYTALVPVNIRCTHDPIKGLSCAAEYPDHCKEQWNFPNPCTPQNLDMNVTKFIHPFDKTKFLMCGDMGKLYVVQCPQFEVFHDGCGQCIGESAGLTASCEVPLTNPGLNPCTREAIIANKLFFPFPGNISKFIHCDIWGKAWERICTTGEVWSQWDVACVNPALLNPCDRQSTNINLLYRHPCDPFKYIKCADQGKAFEIPCGPDKAFKEATQQCEQRSTFPVTMLENLCGNYQFGFRIYSGNDVVVNGMNGMSQTLRGLPGGPAFALGTALSGGSSDGIVVSSGSKFNKADKSRLNALLSAWRQGTLQGNSVGLAMKSGSTDIAVNGQIVDAAMQIHPSQLKKYSFSDIPYSEPCSAVNLAAGRTHFQLRGDPHSFLQCDNNGRMYKMPCSTNSKDWFDVYTMTCVDGPVHVDNHILKQG